MMKINLYRERKFNYVRNETGILYWNRNDRRGTQAVV